MITPRLPAVFQVSTVHATGTRLTVAGLSTATPMATSGYESVRFQLNHHLFNADNPHARAYRDEYHPASLHVSSNASDLPEPGDEQPLVPGLSTSTAAMLPCPPINKGTKVEINLTRSKLTSENSFLVVNFAELLELFGNFSEVFMSLSSLPFAAAHRKRLFNNYALHTVFWYLQAVNQFARVTSQLGLDLGTVSEPQLANVLTVMQLSRQCDTDSDVASGNFTIKAFCWWHQVAGITFFQICFSLLVESSWNTKLSKDIWEAPPLPWWLVLQWECRVLQSAATNYDTMMLESCILIIHACLRFAAAQRLNVDSLVLNHLELRGLVCRSETMSTGHQFGVPSSGLCSTSAFTWFFKLLRTWDEIMRDLGTPRSQCDFRIYYMQPEATFSVWKPLDCAGTTRIFRATILTPWKRFQGDHHLTQQQLTCTLHSMTATLLSVGPLLGTLVVDSDRLLQGHHQDQKQSLNVYSCDAVWGSLRYQRMVISLIQQGWRPITEQHRGGQFPLVRPILVLERYKKDALAYQFEWLPFFVQQGTQDFVQDLTNESNGSDSESSSSARASNSTGSVHPPGVRHAKTKGQGDFRGGWGPFLHDTEVSLMKWPLWKVVQISDHFFGKTTGKQRMVHVWNMQK